MNWIILAVVAVIVSTLAVLVDRYLQAQKVQKEEDALAEKQARAEAAEEPEKALTSGVLERLTSWRPSLTSSKPKLGASFQSWAEAHIADAELKTWLTGLSPEAATALAKQLADFCANLGFELSWLIDDSLQKDLDAQQAAIVIVTAYCQACRQAAQSFAEFELYKVTQKMETAPFVREYQEISRQLFAELVKRHMAPSVPAELFMASDKERREHMTSAIQQAAEKDRDAFKETLRTVLAAQKTNGMEPTVEATNGTKDEPTASDESGTKSRTMSRFRKGKTTQQDAAAPVVASPASEQPAVATAE